MNVTSIKTVHGCIGDNFDHNNSYSDYSAGMMDSRRQNGTIKLF